MAAGKLPEISISSSYGYDFVDPPVARNLSSAAFLRDFAPGAARALCRLPRGFAFVNAAAHNFANFEQQSLVAHFTESLGLPCRFQSCDPCGLLRFEVNKTMSEAKSFLRDLDHAISQGTAESRERALWYATNLLITGGYSEDEIRTFGEVIGRLSEEIELAARAQLASRMAQFGRAPTNIIHKLAFDDAIEVAGPVLTHSERLDSDILVANAETKGQPHLLAISKRKSLDAVVTDVLVLRGNQEVVNSVASNQGARFSGFGFLHMIKRAEGDSILAEQLGLRNDIPRHLFQQLIAKASEDVKKRLGRERPEMVAQI